MPTRREIMAGVGLAGGLALLPRGGWATPALRDEAMAALTKGAAISDGGMTLTIPAVAENGLSVYTTVAVDCPMTADDHVRAIHILSEQNPIAHLLTFHLGPRSGIAKVSTNIRLAASQEVTALAEMSDGRFRRDRKTVIVTIAACIDGG
ncbi:thiosulfate oxidation carrier protein SoxY [Azospirillum sp. ST 5-10]|uniref:thiosulfate oxidation carrier protein SoxY n=1 Tax=unclassified Azospirillum TaxID=2630922 RepID=UPI003F4A6A5C